MSIEERLRKMLLPVFGLDSIDAIGPDKSLVKDLGADSLDFVEIVYLIEKEFAIKLDTKEIVSGGSIPEGTSIFKGGLLTDEGIRIIGGRLPQSSNRWTVGMTKMDIFQSITVSDMAHIIAAKAGEEHAY